MTQWIMALPWTPKSAHSSKLYKWGFGSLMVVASRDRNRMVHTCSCDIKNKKYSVSIRREI